MMANTNAEVKKLARELSAIYDNAQFVRRMGENDGNEWERVALHVNGLIAGVEAMAEKKSAALSALRALHGSGDPEIAHSDADDILLNLIGDAEISNAFGGVPKWYA